MVDSTHFVPVEHGAELFCRLIGQGPPLVFVPGWSFSHEVFEKQVEAFAPHFTCLFYDPRGQGRSTPSLLGNHYRQHARDLLELINRFGLKQPAVMAWSYGALAAYSFVRHFGADSFASFVCIDAPPKPMSEDLTGWAEGPPAVLGEFLRQVQDGQRPFLTDYADYMVTRPLSHAERHWIVEQGTGTPAFVAASLFADGHFSDYRDEARLLDRTIPCLTVLRSDWSDAATRWIEENTPATKTSVFSSHMMFWEDPDRFNEEVLAFLATYRQQRTAGAGSAASVLTACSGDLTADQQACAGPAATDTCAAGPVEIGRQVDTTPRSSTVTPTA